MPIKLIGKSILGEKGFSQVPAKIEPNFDKQLQAVLDSLPSEKKVVMTSMTGSHEVKLTEGAYFPKIREFNPELMEMFDPYKIYENCKADMDKFRPACDFIVWDSEKHDIVSTTFSREAPILAFESSTGKKALGVILRPSLMQYGDYLFSTMKEYLGGKIKITLVTCNYYEYPEGSIPSIFQNLALKYYLSCTMGANSELYSDCYHRGEEGNHVVALW